MLKNFKFDYDYDNDSLFLYNSTLKCKGSVAFGDIIIDFDKKGEISSVELLNATSFFENLNDEFKVERETLKDVAECKVDIEAKNGFFMIKLLLKLKSNKTIATPIIVPTVNEPSPAVA